MGDLQIMGDFEVLDDFENMYVFELWVTLTSPPQPPVAPGRVLPSQGRVPYAVPLQLVGRQRGRALPLRRVLLDT